MKYKWNKITQGWSHTYPNKVVRPGLNFCVKLKKSQNRDLKFYRVITLQAGLFNGKIMLCNITI